MSGFPRLDPVPAIAALKQIAAEHRAPVELTIDGDVLVLHPDDRLIVRARTPITAETAHKIRTTAAQVLGPDRTLVLDATFDITIDRGAPGTSDDDSDAQLAAIDFHHQQTRI